MLFQLRAADDRKTHCGVLEFTAEEGCVYIPFWMMQNLLIEEGALITVKNVSLPKATFVKLQPQSVDFLEITNPRAVLEHALRNYSCVTVNDVIQIHYNSKNYHLQLNDVQPSPAACIIETDCNVDFDAPVGYQEPNHNSHSRSSAAAAAGMMTGDDGNASGSNGFSAANASGTQDNNDKDAPSSSKVRIVNGVVIRPENAPPHSGNSMVGVASDLLAERTGSTGVQHNAATAPLAAPPVDYWAVAAGDGARLDGKPATPLKDSSGQEIDVRNLRAAAAAKRASDDAEKEQASGSSSVWKNGGGNSTTGSDGATTTTTSSTAAATEPVVSKRKSKIGNKFSRLKQQTSAFQGDANTLHKK
jgi:ubiquitin fusion degradation protein 1